MAGTVPKQDETQKVDDDPCTGCGGVVWECSRVTKQTAWPWNNRLDSTYEKHLRSSWPWIGGILVRCKNCKRVWYGNVSMRRFNEIRDTLPENGTMREVQFTRVARDEYAGELMERTPRRFARPKRRS